MIDKILSYAFGYFSGMPWWGYVLVLLVFTQITILSVTLYLHRNQSHRAVDLHPLVSHFFRLWLWLTTGMLTKQWVAIHRKHHTKVETPDDPHSPKIYGIRKVFLEGAELYREATVKDPLLMERYGNGTPDDWLERNVYTRYNGGGVYLMLAADLFFFGVPGVMIFAFQMMWIPFFAAGVINGLGHYLGYRNFETPDISHNLLPLGFFVGGEELHNNHHTYPNSAKFSAKWWEFDIGWLVIRLLQGLRLAKPNYVPPKPAFLRGKTTIDAETIKALMRNRFQVLAEYSKKVILPVLREEQAKAGKTGRALLSRLRFLLIREASLLDSHGKQYLATALDQFKKLGTTYQLRLQLQNLWQQTSATQKELVESLHLWCQQAEGTGIKALRDFSGYLKTYVLQAG